MSDQTSQSFEFRAEIQQLLHILVHSLYTDREIFLRELISNASDALSRVQFEMLTNPEVLDAEAELAVRITFDKDAQTLTVSDTGIGMTQAEMVENLGTIAHSGAAAFLKQLQANQRPATELIGQFGVGFYSAFMVADRIQVRSRSYRAEAEAAAWVSDGASSYEVGPADKTTRGTEVILHLKEDAADLLAGWRLEQIVKRHSDFVAFPIYVEDRLANQRTPIWRQSPRAVERDEYDEFYRQLTLDTEKPRLHVHYVADAPVEIHSILFVPRQREQGVLRMRQDYGIKLYSRHVLIQEYNKDLLPAYFRFVEGVLDSEDIPLNVSRETVQNNRVMTQIQRALTGRLVKELNTLATEQPDEYAAFWREFGVYLKEGVATDLAGKDALLPLLRFHSSQASGADDWTTLEAYVARMAPGQDKIYYSLGDDLQSIPYSPHLDPFKQRGWEVLYLVEPVDSFMIMNLREFDGKSLQNVSSAALEPLPPADDAASTDAAETIPEADFNRLVSRFVEVLGDRVSEVRASTHLTDSPCRLVSPGNLPDQELQRVYRLLDQTFEMPKKTLEINRGHALMHDLAYLVAHDQQSDLVTLEIESLYESALLQEGIHPNPAGLVPRIQALLGRAAQAARGREA